MPASVFASCCASASIWVEHGPATAWLASNKHPALAPSAIPISLISLSQSNIGRKIPLFGQHRTFGKVHRGSTQISNPNAIVAELSGEMAVPQLTARSDLTLDLVHRVAWRGETLALSAAAKDRIAQRRRDFEALLQDPDHGVYGVNQGQGEMIRYRLDATQIAQLARLKPFPAAVSFGDYFPPRVVRAMVLARFANILEGHGFATPRLADALIALLNADTLPRVACTGQGGAGEILATYPLFAALSEGFDLEPGERSTLINGAPGAAALLADVALAARRRLALVQRVLALAIEAFGAPREHYDRALGALWGGAHHRAAFDQLDALLGPPGAATRSHQAPVSYRIIPAVLAQADWAVSQAEATAATALSSVTHNPTYLEPDADHPLGRCISTGGFHNALAAPVIDSVTGVWADLCLLSGRLCAGLLNGRVSGFPDFLLADRDPSESDGHGALGYLPMAIAGFVEEARALAQRSFIPAVDASVFGQDDVAAPAFLAWPKEAKAGQVLDRALAVLAVTASQALHLTKRDLRAGPLRNLLNLVRELVPPVGRDRVLGPELQGLSERLSVSIFETI
jgi:histidine ammonia-lyase